MSYKFDDYSPFGNFKRCLLKIKRKRGCCPWKGHSLPTPGTRTLLTFNCTTLDVNSITHNSTVLLSAISKFFNKQIVLDTLFIIPAELLWQIIPPCCSTMEHFLCECLGNRSLLHPPGFAILVNTHRLFRLLMHKCIFLTKSDVQ